MILTLHGKEPKKARPKEEAQAPAECLSAEKSAVGVRASTTTLRGSWDAHPRGTKRSPRALCLTSAEKSSEETHGKWFRSA